MPLYAQLQVRLFTCAQVGILVDPEASPLLRMAGGGGATVPPPGARLRRADLAALMLRLVSRHLSFLRPLLLGSPPIFEALGG